MYYLRVKNITDRSGYLVWRPLTTGQSESIIIKVEKLSRGSFIPISTMNINSTLSSISLQQLSPGVSLDRKYQTGSILLYSRHGIV